jgi:8-oxo-dGTP pyrophosphatase MutT (NUDIX family)
MRLIEQPSPDSIFANRIERPAVRVVLTDDEGAVLLLSTRDASNPDFGSSWELPGGGVLPSESPVEAAVREVREETGLAIAASSVSPPLWTRDVLYTYRGERRLQHETIFLAKVAGSAPIIDVAGREPFEIEDHLLSRWWSISEIKASSERFYPRSLPRHIVDLGERCHIDEPIEVWDDQ